MDQDVVDRIRSASFALARKGYEKREVDRFLDQLADWLETGGDDSARTDLVRRELERIGEQTTAILTEAHDAAETMRAGGERQVRQQLADANITADSLRSSAEEYAEEVREEADSYARRVRAEADAAAERARIEIESSLESTRDDADDYANLTRREADEYAQRVRGEADTALAESRETAERSARQVVEDANRRRGEVEKVISDLEQRREAIVGELRRLVNAAGVAEQGDAPTGGSPKPAAAEDTGLADERTRPMPTRAE